MTGWHAAKRLRGDFALVLSGNVVYSACQWGIVVALAKLGNPEKVGEYAIGLAVSAPVVLFANLQLRALQASDVTGQFTFNQYLTFRLASLCAALVVVGAVAGTTQPSGHLGAIVMLVGFAQALEFASETYYGFMQRHERMDRVSQSLMLKGPLSLAVLCAAMYLTHNVVWAVLGLVFGRLSILLFWDSRLAFAKTAGTTAEVRLQWNTSEMLTVLRMALPLGVISMLVSLNSSIPRYFVAAYSGSAELGIFSAIASLLSAGNLVVSAFGQSVFLPVAKACATCDRGRYRAFVLQSLTLGAALGGCGVLAASVFGRNLLAHIFRPGYAAHNDIFVGLMFAGTILFMASGLGYVATAARCLNPQIPLMLATALAATVTSALWVPSRGLRGAVDSALATAFVQLAGTGVILWRIDRQLQVNTGSRMTLPVTAPHSGV